MGGPVWPSTPRIKSGAGSDPLPGRERGFKVDHYIRTG